MATRKSKVEKELEAKCAELDRRIEKVQREADGWKARADKAQKKADSIPFYYPKGTSEKQIERMRLLKAKWMRLRTNYYHRFANVGEGVQPLWNERMKCRAELAKFEKKKAQAALTPKQLEKLRALARRPTGEHLDNFRQRALVSKLTKAGLARINGVYIEVTEAGKKLL